MSTDDAMRSEYAVRFTEETLWKARKRAAPFARATRGALSEDDLVQRACLRVWSWMMSSAPHVRDLDGSLREAIRHEYVAWLRGANPSREQLTRTSDRDAYFASTSIDDVSEGANPPQLTSGNPVDGWSVERDVRRALETLTPTEQEQVYRLYWRGELLHEVGARTGVTKQRVSQRVQAIAEKLRPLLADYAPHGHVEKRWNGTRSPSR